MRVRRVHRRSELAVLAFQVLFGDPTGPTAKASNGYSSALGVQLISDPLQRRHTNTMDLSCYIVLDEGRGLTHEDDTPSWPASKAPFAIKNGKVALVASSVPCVPIYKSLDNSLLLTLDRLKRLS